MDKVVKDNGRTEDGSGVMNTNKYSLPQLCITEIMLCTFFISIYVSQINFTLEETMR